MTDISQQQQYSTSDPGSSGAFGAGSSDSADVPDPQEMASAAAQESSAVAHNAVEQSSAVAHNAVEAGMEVASEARAQLADVTGQAKDQVADMVGRAKQELQRQAEMRAEQAAASLQTFADQLAALEDGRLDDAGHVGVLVGDAQHRVQAYVQTLQVRGPQTVIDDLAKFARRRPAVFLLGAAMTGFAAGRLARAAAAANGSADPEGVGEGTRPVHADALVASGASFGSTL